MKYIIIIFISLLLTNFLGATSLPNTPLLILLVPFVVLELNNRSIFSGYIIAIIIGLIISMVSCYYYRDQSVFDTFRGSANFFYIMFYFMIRRINPSLAQMEKALLILAVIFSLSYIVQYIIYPTVIFSGAKDEFTDDIRIRLGAQGLGSLGYFFGLNKFLTWKKVNYLLLSILCFCVILLMGFRTMLAGLAIFTLIMIIRVYGFSWKIVFYGILATGVFVVILQLPAFSEKMNFMFERQEADNFNNSDYIRIVGLQYFTQDHFKNIGEFILGSGMPFEGTKYGNYMNSLTESGIYYVDWGLLGLSWIIGIFPVIVMILYSVKTYRIKVKKEYYYIGIWFLYLVVTSITTMEFYRHGNFVVQAIALFMVGKMFEYSIKTNLAKGNKNIRRFNEIPELR